MNKKSGITLMSILLYVVLFFAFTVFAIGMSSNMNYKAMDEKASIFINEQFAKLQYNMLMSAKSSNSIDNILDRIVFSNNDEYVFDSTKNKILKNGGNLVQSVEEFKIIDVSELKDKPQNFDLKLDNSIDSICIEVKFKKYGKEITKQLFLTAEVENEQ